MQYWEEMQTKFGFSDGEAIPPDACEVREVYVRTLNRLLEKHGSEVRIAAYNRPGCHNCFLIISIPAELYDAAKVLDGKSYENTPETDEDDAYYEAVEEAEEMGLDSYVSCEVKIAPNFEEFLAGL